MGVITPENEYERLWKCLSKLETLVTKFETVLTEREKNCKRHDVCLNNLKDRVHSLELSRAEAKGKNVVLAVVASSVISLLFNVTGAFIIWHLKKGGGM